jgi:hypothetical protein
MDLPTANDRLQRRTPAGKIADVACYLSKLKRATRFASPRGGRLLFSGGDSLGGFSGAMREGVRPLPSLEGADRIPDAASAEACEGRPLAGQAPSLKGPPAHAQPSRKLFFIEKNERRQPSIGYRVRWFFGHVGHSDAKCTRALGAHQR